MKELSIFVDEAGDFGDYEKHNPYYIVTMVFHDQSEEIDEEISVLNRNLMNILYLPITHSVFKSIIQVS